MSSLISEIYSPLFGFHSIFMFFLKASNMMVRWVRIFITTQLFPISLVAFVLFVPSSISSPSSFVKVSLLHRASNSFAIRLEYPLSLPLREVTKTGLTTPGVHKIFARRWRKTSTTLTGVRTWEHIPFFKFTKKSQWCKQ